MRQICTSVAHIITPVVTHALRPSLPWDQTNPNPLRTCHRQTQLLHPLCPIPILQPLKLLRQPNNGVTRLRKCKLLSDTNPRSPIKRQISPSRSQIFLWDPTFRSEVEGV